MFNKCNRKTKKIKTLQIKIIMKNKVENVKNYKNNDYFILYLYFRFKLTMSYLSYITKYNCNKIITNEKI